MPDDRLSGRLQRAEQLLGALDAPAAFAEFAAMREAAPQNVPARCGRVRALWAMRETRAAQQELAEVLRGSGDGAAVRVAKGTLALGVPDHPAHISIMYGSAGRDDDEACAEFEAAVELAPESVAAWRGLAVAHRLAWRLEKARATLDRASAHHPDHPGLRVERVWCLHDEGEMRAAFDEAMSVLAAAPADFEVLVVTATFARLTGEYGHAWTAVEELRRRRPDHVLRLYEECLLEYATAQCYEYPEVHADALKRGDAVAAELYAAHARWPAVVDAVQDRMLASAIDVAGIHGSPVFVTEGRVGEPPSPSLLEIRGLQLSQCARMSDGDLSYRRAAVSAYRAARQADPHHITSRVNEARELCELGELDEARAVLAPALDHSPAYPRFLAEQGWIEFVAGRHEAALGFFERAGHSGELGRISALRWLGCIDLAEKAIADARARTPSNVAVLNELANCAFDEGHYLAARRLFGTALEFAPGDATAKAGLKSSRVRCRMRWLRGPWHTVEDQVIGELAAKAPAYERLDRRLPEVAPLRLHAAMREFDRHQATATARGKLFEDSLFSLLALCLLALLFLTPHVTRPIDNFADTTANFWIQVGVNFAALLVLFAVAGAAQSLENALQLKQDRALTIILTSITLLDAAGIGWLLVRGAGRADDLAFVGLVSLAYMLAFFWFVVAILAILDRINLASQRRVADRLAVAPVVHGLLDLLDLLDYEPWLVLRENRAECVRLLDQVARSLGRTVVLSGNAMGSRRESAKSAQIADRLRAEGIAAATRDLKELVFSPKADSWAKLREQAQRMLHSIAHGYWGELPTRKPDPVVKLLFQRALIMARGLLVVVTPPAVLATYQLINGKGFTDLPPQLALVVYLGWPLLSLMWWIDPNLPAKLSSLRQAKDMTASSQPGPSRERP